MFTHARPIIVGILAAIALNSYLTPLHIEAKFYENTRQNTYNKPSREPYAIPTITQGNRQEAVSPIPRFTPTPTAGERYLPVRTGQASFYTNEYCRKHNPRCHTASGEVFDDTQLTAACSSTYDLGSTLRVTHGDVSILVRCNDRGSFEGKYNRVLDLSKAAFQALAPLSKGHIAVEIETVN